MPNLQTVGRRFETEFYTVAGYPFQGVIQPLDEGSVASYDFTEPRMIMRVRYDCPVHTGTVFADQAGRKFLMADHDIGGAHDDLLYRTHRIYRMNATVEWARQTPGGVDALTGLTKSAGKTTLGQIDAMIEVFGREDLDPSIKVREQTRRLVTNAPIQLGDMVDGMIVKRLDKSLGVWVAEIE